MTGSYTLFGFEKLEPRFMLIEHFLMLVCPAPQLLMACAVRVVQCRYVLFKSADIFVQSGYV